MNRKERIGTRQKIEEFLLSRNDNELFIYADFETCGSYASVRDAVVDLCKNHILIRIAQGIYAKPSVRYTVSDIAMTICRKSNCKGVVSLDTVKDDIHIIRIFTTGSSRNVKTPDGTIMKFVHKDNV